VLMSAGVFVSECNTERPRTFLYGTSKNRPLPIGEIKIEH